MGLVYNSASSLLHQIVGGSGFSTSNIKTYLGLSTTKPFQVPESGSYNINEPIQNSYSRIELNASLFPNVTYEEDEDGNMIYSTTNNAEIHFNECTEAEGWTDSENRAEFKYFAIFSSSSGGTPIYVGQMENTEVSGIIISKDTVPLVRKEALTISVK